MAIEKLACKLGRNDEAPNIELAECLCAHGDRSAIKEIVGGFCGKDKAVAGDCIKVLYETGKRRPELISPYASEFADGLRSKNNRLVWGSMMALAQITQLVPQLIFERLSDVIAAYEAGSVITADYGVSVLAGLCKAGRGYAETVLPILLAHLQTCRPKEVAQHAERASVCFEKHNANAFIGVLEQRCPHLPPPQQARVKKLLKALYSLQKDQGPVFTAYS